MHGQFSYSVIQCYRIAVPGLGMLLRTMLLTCTRIAPGSAHANLHSIRGQPGQIVHVGVEAEEHKSLIGLQTGSLQMLTACQMVGTQSKFSMVLNLAISILKSKSTDLRCISLSSFSLSRGPIMLSLAEILDCSEMSRILRMVSCPMHGSSACGMILIFSASHCILMCWSKT